MYTTSGSSSGTMEDEEDKLVRRLDSASPPPQQTETIGSESTGAEDWLLEELDALDRMSVRTQTLEEIMAEKNSDFMLPDEDELLLANGDADSVAATSAAAPIAPMGRYGSMATELPSSYQLESPLLLHRADAISHQIASVQDRPDGGRPTVLCVGRDLLAVGTTRGLCMLFQRSTEKLARFVHAEKDFGSISCLDFSPDQQRLCAGFSMGSLMVFDCAKGRILFRGADLIQPGRGILHVKYISSFALLIVDNGGNVYEFHERHSRRKRNGVRCLFTGSKGEVTNICFMHTVDVELLVLATFHQVLLLSTKRRGAPAGQLRLHGSSLYPPIIDWHERRMGLTTAHTLIRDLRLCVALEREIRIYHVRKRVGGDLVFPLSRVVHAQHPLLNLKWLDDSALLAIVGHGGDEQLQIMELHRHERKKSQSSAASVTATAELGQQVQLVYNSADFKGMTTGRNVSEAMYNLADSVCFHSVCRYSMDEQVHLLGRNGIFRVQLQDQAEQLQQLVGRHDLASALLYAVDVCNGRVRDHSRVGDFRTRVSRQIPQLIRQLLDQTLDGLDSGRIDELIAHYKRNIHVLMRACVATSHFELLYGTVYSELQKDSLCRPIFLELLEEFVLESQLDRPPPSLVNDYLSYLLAEGQLPQFEQSVVRLPVECMDLHQVMTACLQNQLFDGLCYVMNNAMRDYVGPLKEMLDHLQRFVHKEVLSDCEIAQGNKLLLYLSCCLAGRAYPYGELPDEYLCNTVPLETYKFLVQLRPKFVPGPPSSGSSPSPTTMAIENDHHNNNNNVHRRKPTSAELRFPHIQLLLALDAQQFLNVISTCADAPVFAHTEGRLKRLVDILVAKCVESGDEEEDNELGPLLIAFVAGLLQKGAIPRDVFLFTQLIERVLQRRFPNLRAQKQAEQAVVDLLRTVPEIEADRVLEIAQQRPFVHICAYIFTVRKQYVQLLECCLGDPVEPKHVFPILDDLLTHLREPEQLDQLRQFVRRQIGRLSSLDPELSARLVLAHLPDLLVKAKSNPRKLPFPLLRQCFLLRRQQGHRTLSGEDEEQDELFFDCFFEGTIDQAVGNKDDEMSSSLDGELAALLRYWLPLGSLTDHCLNLAMQQRENGFLLLETVSLLLVARGHIDRAFEHIFREGIMLDKNQPPIDRWISSLLELAVAYPAEARRGDWLTKLFRYLLNLWPNATEDPNAKIQELLRSDSPLSRVFTAIIEQQQEEDEEAEKGGKSTPMVALVAELFAHPLMRHAPLHSLHRIVRQMLLWSEIRVLMERATRDCVRHELAERFARHMLGHGTRPAFNIPSLDATASTTGDGGGRNADHCPWCERRIQKSFYLFPCGHTLHLECVEQTTNRSCPCCNSAEGNKMDRKDPTPPGDGPCSSKLGGTTKETETIVAGGNQQCAAANKVDERRLVGSIFRYLQNDFPLCTGPPPPVLPPPTFLTP